MGYVITDNFDGRAHEHVYNPRCACSPGGRRDQLEALCPKHCRIVTSPERLEAISDDTAGGDVTIFSPFIHSAVNHPEPDHSGGLPAIMRLCPTPG